MQLIQKLRDDQKCMKKVKQEVYGLLSSCLLQYFSYKLIQKLRDDQKCMKKVKHSSRSKATEDIIIIGSFLEVLVLNHYVLVRRILNDLNITMYVTMAMQAIQCLESFLKNRSNSTLQSHSDLLFS
ncbi:hypothetical protein Tco_1154325 [Tanacetum coccineum]